ncbi:endoglucanase [Gordonia amicalis]|uniref:glycoside hydrolase family 26 protein n=1 Tax=Gordonia amicalis TaxID=89053 RepID=UPI001EDCE866|nr:glycosyl hydrolase [Gordonia amicalis]UKO93379.1 endoglucanase [Gordonia amicalis]
MAQEMNGDWYPWSIGTNGNTPGDFKAVWARIHAIVTSQASNVSFVWAPNVVTDGTQGFAECFPGSHLVDYLGLDGYNWGETAGHQWQSAHTLFTKSLSTLTQLDSEHPILITEVGCAEGDQSNLKPQWIRDFFTVIGTNDRVAAFIWFQMDKERDWRFNSSPLSARAFRESLAAWTHN